MRNLTIVRKKSMVACLMKLKVYVQDDGANDLIADGMSFRLVGRLANNGSITFEIGEHQVYVYVMFDKFMTNFSYGKVLINAGQEDLTIYGKNKFAPFQGNPFAFDRK